MRLHALRTYVIGAALIGAVMLTLGTSSTPAYAACKTLGFTVNHYGKEGPTRDAKALLDKYIVTWAAERGIKKFRQGKKTVTCFKFLDFGFFDEWTCKAVSKVCFRGKIPLTIAEKAKAKKDARKAAAAKRAEKRKAKKLASKKKKSVKKASVKRSKKRSAKKKNPS